MPLTPAQIAASVNNKSAPKQDYGLNNQIDALPNSEKLTSVERGIYKALPGISENKTLQTIGGALSDFDKWLGGYPSKLLGYLDVGAEGVERTVGLLSQMQEKDFSIDELKSAWYAGGLTADVINLPTIGRDENGNISGIRVPIDLPGIQGLASARKEIQTLVEGGATYGDALKQVRESYYDNLGALALRAQLYDTYFHIAADPLNYIMPNLAPIDALQARRISALEKVAVNSDEALQISSDILKHTDELNALLKTEKDAGKIAKITAAVEENTRFAAQLAKGEKTLNTGDKIAIMLTGGDPFGRRITKLDDIATKVKDIPVLNWFQLTPAARAQEAVMRVGDNIGSTLVQRLYNSPDFVNEFKNAISRISQGAVGVEYGHAITTLEGRSVQSLVKGVEAITSKTIDGFQSVQKERDLLNVLSQTLGESVESVLKNADANPEALLTRLSGKNPLLDQMVKNGEVSTETLKYISGMFKDGKVPYNKDMLIATVLDQIETQAMQQAVVQFGVKARGTVTRWAEAVKAAESLAFLRLNPAYPIRNMINNDVTMIARGVFGVLDNNAIDDYIKLHNLGISKKLSQGFTTAELSGFDAATDGANKVIQDALKGGNYGVPEKAKEFFQNLNFGAVDNKGWSWARNIESKASKRAFTVGHMEYMYKYAKYSRLEDLLDADVLSEIQKLYPNFTQEYNNVVKAAAGVDGELDDFLSSNLNVNTESVFEQASMKLGVDVKEILGTDILSHIKNGLPDAIKNNKVESFVMETRQKINDHIDDLFNKQLENQIEHVKSQVIAGGPQVWYQKMGDAQDMVSSVQTEHAIRMPSVTREAREAAKTGDYAKADILWRQLAEDDRKIFNRTFRRVEAYMEGMDKAQAELASRGINLPRFEEVKMSFTDWRKGWEDFFSFRNEKHREFFSNRKAGNWDAMQKEISSKYEAMGLEEDRLMQQIDDIVAAQIPDPLLQEAFTSSRDAIAEIRQKIKQAVIDTRARVEDMPADKAQLEWNKLWQERQAQYAEVKNLDAMGRAIMQGDGKAANAFLGAPTDLEKAAGEGVQAAVLERIKRRASKIKEANAAGEAGKLVGEDSQKISEYLSTVSEGMTQKARDFGKAQREARGTGQVVKLKYEKLSEVVSSLPNEEASLSLADITKKASQYDFTVPPELKTFFEESGGYATRREILEFSARLELGLIEKKAIPTNFIGDITKILPEPMPIDLGEDLMAYGRSYSALDAIVDGAKTQAEKTPLFMKDLPQNVQAKLQSAISRTRDEFSSVRNQAVKYAGYKRDSALLNYNRRTNFDTMVGNIFPYAFWTTGSMAKWAIHSIDRPAMLTNYLRTKKFIETAGLQQDGLPSRVKGNIRIPMPFAPEWMGDFYVDPLRLVLPFDGFAQPFEQMQQAQTTAEGRTQRLLEEKLNSGEITQSEFDDAIDNQGALWEQAMTEVQQNDSAQKYDAWDFATTMSSPHAPIVWAYNAASGHTEDIGPFAPLSRLMRNAATLMGVKDWNNSSWNVEAKVRKQLGLNAFDKWDNYRIDRALSDLAGNGEYTVDEVKEAMYISALVQAGKLTPEQAKEKSPVYAKGVERANQEFSGTPVTFALSLLGINVKSVPEGEMNLRRLQTQFSQAYEKYDIANQSIIEFAQAHPDMTEEEALDAWEKANPKIAREGDALTRFFDEHPEYETRLGLFDKPEVKIQKFLIDQIWARYNDLPKVNKDEIREMLGPEFQESFLNKETRAPQNLTPEQLSIYLKLMGGDPVGTLTATESALLSLVQKPLTDPETANRVQVFYDTRQQTFGNYYDLQSEYFALDKSKRKQYLQQNPELGKYWDWRRDFMNNNPDLVPYLTDNMADIEKAAKKYREQGAPGVVPTAQEINVNIDPLVKELIADYGQTGEPLPPVVLRELDRVAAQYGLTTEQLKNILGVRQ